jgi:hypothetical protein
MEGLRTFSVPCSPAVRRFNDVLPRVVVKVARLADGRRARVYGLAGAMSEVVAGPCGAQP